ncbi:DUF2268 domain-containing protein [Phytomonospora endophytica]|uniref:Uncharacterized protein YjaZ n=1 Tax=Phytomonospora endophytica TaxID=714109 RepID=A0A841FSM8_9ACTN|nr:DUF2268 domain-containing putative Zn-dependent protease [Phytomonospora endophytica]MBB6037813.1 uncharacterized protein YjaZ [Phytomonospora endophytica]GIG67658.1 hypothetical protein Pen01_39530 [Phytomonospora endophytica]
MTITVLDTHTGMHAVLTALPADRERLLREMLEPARGLYRYFPGEVDLVAFHGRSAGFPFDRDGERCLDALATLAEAEAWQRIQRALDDALAAQTAAVGGLDVPDITVLLLLGDPGDELFMGHSLGVTGNGSVTGHIAITLWPSPENLARLEATAVHELNHNLRYLPGGVVWNPATVDVGEHVVSEGLADAFARSLHGDDLGRTRIGVPHLHDDEVFAKVVTGLGVTGMQNFAAWVHGDVIAAAHGATPVGLPTGAGYSAANRIVDAYLAATGKSPAEALHDDSKTIIATALEQGG